jgi:hypothetical protein
MSQVISEPGGASKKKKTTKPKPKEKEKNKELSFVFQDTDTNYLNFLAALLDKHSFGQYTPVTNHHRFLFQVIVPPNKACVIR